MSLLLVMPGRDTAPVVAALGRLDASLPVQVWPQVADPDGVVMAVTWNHPAGALAGLPGLRLVCSYGAGVDHLLRDPALPAGVPLARVVDPNLVTDMVEYVVGALGAWRRGFAGYRDSQARGEWRPRVYDRDRRALVLGLGQLGGAVADALVALGWRVDGWSRSGRAHPGLRVLRGRPALLDAVGEVAVVVCLLPLTPATAGVVDGELLARCRPGSLLVNVARGGHLVEVDLLTALDRGRPAAAWLDVFDDEPLPPGHPFWRHPAITITPHVASLTDPESVARQLVRAYRRTVAGEPPEHAVERGRGY